MELLLATLKQIVERHSAQLSGFDLTTYEIIAKLAEEIEELKKWQKSQKVVKRPKTLAEPPKPRAKV